MTLAAAAAAAGTAGLLPHCRRSVGFLQSTTTTKHIHTWDVPHVSERGQVKADTCAFRVLDVHAMARQCDDVTSSASVSSSTDATTASPTPSDSSPLVALPSTEWVEFNLDTRSAPPPPEWREELQRRREAEVRAKGGVSIRRRPPTGPSSHAVGPFEFKVQNEENVPQNILEEIVWNKDKEVSKMKEQMPLSTLLNGIASVVPARDFVGTLRQRAKETGVPALIAEVKKASPSRGIIQPDFDPVEIAQAYERGGAACISVLTDSKYFKGSFENLKLIRAAGVQCPLLCKEFIIDAWQLYFARVKGADAVLLIAAILPDQDLRYMTKIARALGMAALIEVHTEREMERVLGLKDVQLIGINNRDLETFKQDIHTTARLLEGGRAEEVRRRGILLVGESGLFTPDDIAVVQAAGCEAVLVGESLVKEKDPEGAIKKLFGKDIARPHTHQEAAATATAS